MPSLIANVDVDDLERGQAAGARLEGAIQEASWGRMAILADPFGNGLCLIQFAGRGYDEMIEG